MNNVETTNLNGGGWICLHRKMLDTSWYNNTNAVRLAVHLLLSATHKDIDVYISTQRRRLLRGQLFTGRKMLAKQLGLTEDEVRGALIRLKDSGFCTQHSTHHGSVVTICNYNAYQSKEPVEPQQFPQPLPPESPTPTPEIPTKQQYNKGTSKQYITIVQKSFDRLWEMYPNKVGRKLAFSRFKASVKDSEDIQQCYNALINYKNSKRVKDGYVQNGSTWFNNWQDWVTNPESSDPLEEMRKL